MLSTDDLALLATMIRWTDWSPTDATVRRGLATLESDEELAKRLSTEQGLDRCTACGQWVDDSLLDADGACEVCLSF